MKQASKQPTGRRTQRGMASILITMITMMVISLIVLGFANVARRERGQSLDRQLSTQAFYAAESGIEDARKVIDAAVKNGAAVPGRTDCINSTAGTAPNGVPLPNYPSGTAMQLKDGGNVSYSCLLVDPNPKSLLYKGVSNAESTVIPVKPASGVLESIEVSWTPPQNSVPACARTNGTNVGGSACAAGPTRCLEASLNTTSDRFLLPSGQWNCKYGLMRMDIVPTAPPGGLNRQALLNRSVAAWMVPTQSTTASGVINYGSHIATQSQRPFVNKAKCQTGPYGTCTATISGLAGSGNEFSLRLTSQYQPSDVTVTARASGVAAGLTGAQAVIDVTGKAEDVLRRVVARVPVNASRGQVTGYAIQSNGSICKRFKVRPDTPGNPAKFEIEQDLPSGSGNHDNSNDMCKAKEDPIGP